MKKILFTLLLSILVFTEVMAVPAINKPVKRTLPDGSEITVRIYGDEFYSYTTTDDGYNVVESGDGYFYYATLEGSTLKNTSVRARDVAKRGASDAAVLRRVARGVPAAVVKAANNEARRARGVAAPNKLGDVENRVGKLKTLVILVNFADNAFTVTNPKTAFTNLLSEDGYSRNGSTGSAWNYYHDNSNGQFDVEFEVVGPYTLPQKMAYYGAAKDKSNDTLPAQMAVDACTLADADVNFADFAEDGYIRDIFIFYAGVNQAEGGPSDTVWPHRWAVYSGNATGNTLFDGVRLQYYACSSELRGSAASLANPDGRIANIGTFCHEFGHVLGWCDYYNTSGESNTVNLGELSLMSGGNYNNESRTPPAISAFDRYMVGWLTPTELVKGGNYSLGTLNSANEAYMIKSDTEGEYFIIENRDKDFKWDKYMTGENYGSSVDGMIIYHIDRSAERIDKWGANKPNVLLASYAPDHECMKVVRPIQSDNVKDWFFPGKSNYTTVNSESVLEYVCWSGKPNGFDLSNIIVGADKTITFDVATADAGSLTGKVLTVSGAAISGATVELYSLTESASESGMMCIRRAASTPSFSTTTATDGTFALENLPLDKYSLKVSYEGYDDYTDEVIIAPRATSREVTLYKTILEANLTEVNWHKYYAGALGFESLAAIGGGAAFSLADIPVNADKAMLAGANIYTSSVCDATFQAFKRRNGIYTELCSVDMGRQTARRWVYVDLTDKNIFVEGDDEVVTVFTLSNYTQYPLSIDDGPAVNNKGNLVYYSGQWDTYDESNIMVGAFFSFPDAESATLNSRDKTLYVGDCEKLKYTASPSGTVASIDWNSSNEETITFSGDYAMAVGSGTATVSGTYKEASIGSVRFTVQPELADVVVDVKPTTMDAVVKWTAKTTREAWTVEYFTAADQTAKSVKTTSPEVTLPSLTPDTEYTIRISGNRTIQTEQLWGVYQTTFTTPQPQYAEELTIDKHSIELYITGTSQLTATVTPADAYGSDVIWSTSDEAIATVSAEGLVCGTGQGTATITASTRLNNLSASCTVNVVAGLVEPTFTVSQHDVFIDWESSAHTGDWLITYGRMYDTTTTVEQKTKSLYLDRLVAGTRYVVAIAAIDADGNELAHKDFDVYTQSTNGVYPMLCNIKGTYAASDKITLRLGNFSKAIESVEWSVDGAEVTPPVIQLAAGNHTVSVVVTLTDGSTQKLIKYITVK